MGLLCLWGTLVLCLSIVDLVEIKSIVLAYREGLAPGNFLANCAIPSQVVLGRQSVGLARLIVGCEFCTHWMEGELLDALKIRVVVVDLPG